MKCEMFGIKLELNYFVRSLIIITPKKYFSFFSTTAGITIGSLQIAPISGKVILSRNSK